MARKISFGKILATKPEGDSFSLVTELDKFCSEGGVSVGTFSVLGMKRACKNMLEVLEDFDREKFFTEFFKMYNLAMAPDLRSKNVFHPSGLMDDCPRRLTYDLSGVAPSNPRMRTISGELQRTFDVGSWYHLYFQNLLFALGYLEQAEVPVVNKEKFIDGKADGVFKPEVFGEEVLLEIKSMNSFMFGRSVWAPFKKHEYQASLYAQELGIKKILYLYINKDNSQIRTHLMPTNDEMLLSANTKMEGIITAVKEKILPKRMCGDKFCDRAVACEFRDLCFKV